MHGVILWGLKQFVVSEYGEEAWDAVTEEAAVDRSLYVPVTTYPDEHVFEIVGTAAELTGESPETLQYEFGRFIVPHLVETYGVHVDGDWTGLDLVRNVEEYIHEALRAKKMAEFAPPGIDAETLDDDRVLVTYSSDRELCNVARGILDGVAAFYDEEWSVTERTCMHEGDRVCELLVDPAAESPATVEDHAHARPVDGD